MKYCKRCLYPVNHLLNITFDEQGVCSECRVYETKDSLPWDARRKELANILNNYRNRSADSYDCIIPVGGGGDSYFVVHTITKVFKMNPLLVTFNHEYNTKIGIRNLANLLTVFDCDHVNYTLNPGLIEKLVKHSLRKFGSMYWHVLAGMLRFPVQIAVKTKIPLVIWGLNGWAEQAGIFACFNEEKIIAKKVKGKHNLIGIDAKCMIDKKASITRRDIEPFIYPSAEELEKVGVRGVYLGDYIRWDQKKQHELMIDLYGYETVLHERTFNTYEDVDCFRSAGTRDYIKFLKYGYGKVNEHASREIRFKRMTREEGIEIVKKYENKKPADLPVFLKWIGMTEKELCDCIEPFRDLRIWKRNKDGKWRLLDSVINHACDEEVDKVRLEKMDNCKFTVTPSRELGEPEDKYVLMGRGYIDKYNFKAIKDNQEEIQQKIEVIRNEVDDKLQATGFAENGKKDSRLKRREMRYCTRCVMPDTKPGVYLDEEGVCSACRSVERKKYINWETNAKELKELCDRIRGSNGNSYDCLVPVSGGKDSYFQTWMMKVVHKMNVLAVCVVPHLQTREGIANLNNLVKTFNVDLIKIALKPSVFKAIRKRAFFEMGEPNWADHSGVIAGATRIAYLYHIPLIVWGEDIAVEFGGKTSNECISSAEDFMRGDVVRGITVESFYDGHILPQNTLFYREIDKKEIKKRAIRSIYLGYYVSWDGLAHFEFAKKYGFQERHMGPLSGNIINYDNIDEKLCEINIWFKFLKFGFWRPTNQCCYQIWNGRMAREEAVKLVNKKQYEFPAEYLRDFLEFHGITEEEFWQNVAKWRNRDIWHRINGEWRLKLDLT